MLYREDRLIELFSEEKQRELMLLEKIRQRNEAVDSSSSLFYRNSQLAILSILLERDARKSKGHFHLAAKCVEFLHRGSAVLTLSFYCHAMLFAVLSDNRHLIETFCGMEPKLKDFYKKGAFYSAVVAVQGILTGNDEKLESSVEKLHLRFEKKERSYKAYSVVFEGFLEKDGAKINQGVRDFLKTQKRRAQGNVLDMNFSLEATAMAKLAILQGYAIDVVHELMPPELLEVNELETYPSYFFFDGPG